MPISIYVLRLTNSKFYVGKSASTDARIDAHIAGNGSAWTRLHPPLDNPLDKLIENASPFDEDKIVKEYMLKYGIDAVRGGSYSQIELSDEQIAALKLEIWAATDKCTRCGHDSHFVAECYATKDVTGMPLPAKKSSQTRSRHGILCHVCGTEFDNPFDKSCHEQRCAHTKPEENAPCERCGRKNHETHSCYAKTHISGKSLESECMLM